MTFESPLARALASDQRPAFLARLGYELAMAERSAYRDSDLTPEQALRLVAFLNEVRLVLANQLVADTTGALVGHPDDALIERLAQLVHRADMGPFWARTVDRAARPR
ncbi:hypothetical protein GCM10010441_21320 [Kitasatospora paracochleata]|uniref:Uncharacterized protein n=1 Tax=Kitasatospora paracochleata TaxID=58354 RepID=A0ABT1J7S3_9ACTN|nr:hypothetical protein [Kitasatospora paracochleata]MCP2313492.1 hypothetical protein [Kitasatospora paracochleata]